MKTLRVGIASYEEMKARTLATARGEARVTLGEPKVWFTSPAREQDLSVANQFYSLAF